MPFIVTEYKRCQSHPNSIQPGDTGNCYKQFKVMLCNLVSIHHSPRPVEYPKACRQHQDRLNRLLWLGTHSQQLPHADPPLSSMSHQHSALNNLCRCSHETNEIRYCKIMWQPQMLSSTRLWCLNDWFNKNHTIRCIIKRFNEYRRTNTPMRPSSFNTFLKQMTSSEDLQDYPDWTYLNTFGAYETCGPPTQESKISWP